MKGLAFEPIEAGVTPPSGLGTVTLADACMVVTVDTDGKDKGDNKDTTETDVHAKFKFYVFKNAIVTDEAGGVWLNGD